MDTCNIAGKIVHHGELFNKGILENALQQHENIKTEESIETDPVLQSIIDFVKTYLQNPTTFQNKRHLKGTFSEFSWAGTITDLYNNLIAIDPENKQLCDINPQELGFRLKRSVNALSGCGLNFRKLKPKRNIGRLICIEFQKLNI